MLGGLDTDTAASPCMHRRNRLERISFEREKQIDMAGANQVGEDRFPPNAKKRKSGNKVTSFVRGLEREKPKQTMLSYWRKTKSQAPPPKKNRSSCVFNFDSLRNGTRILQLL